MNKIDINNLDERFELDDKRFRFPAVLETDCPKCNQPIIVDFMEEYLSYPYVNEVFEQIINCGECSNEFGVKLKLVIKLEVA